MFCDLCLKIALSAAELLRSCDLTPFDYYLLGAVKDKCCADKPETIDTLKDNIGEAIGCTQPIMFLKIGTNIPFKLE